MVIVNAISIVANNQLSLICYHNAMKIRVAVCSLVYKKVLRMSQSAMGDATPGKIINLLSNDVNRFDSLTKFGSALWTSPILVIAVGYLLLQEAQWAGLIGMAIVFIIVPIQSECHIQLVSIAINNRKIHFRLLEQIVSEVSVSHGDVHR